MKKKLATSIIQVERKVKTGGSVDMPGHQSNSMFSKRFGFKGARQRVVSRRAHLSPDFM